MLRANITLVLKYLPIKVSAFEYTLPTKKKKIGFLYRDREIYIFQKNTSTGAKWTF